MSEVSQPSSSSLLFLPEILLEIFAHCAPSDLVALRTTDTPLALSAVSRLWRTCAHASPALWTNIVLTQKTVHTVPLWLERSCDLPMSILVCLEKPTSDDERELYDSLLGQLNRQLHRCRFLDVSIPDEALLEQLLPSRSLLSLPVLETMQVHVDQDWWRPLYRSSWNRLDLPSIRMLRFRGNAAQQLVRSWRHHLQKAFLPTSQPLVVTPEVSLFDRLPALLFG
jgi:hypothetical protein